MRAGRGWLCWLVVSAGAVAQTGQVAQRPPMGWNSWDAYALTISEAQFRANVEVQADRLKNAGYQYAVIDEGWYIENPEDRPTPEKLRYAFDGYGRYVPVPARFPSAAKDAPSFHALGEWVHSEGLKFGIHIIRGIPKESVAKNAPVQGSGFHAKDVADIGDACPWDPTSWGVHDNAAGQAWYDSLFRQYADWGVDFVKVDCVSDHPYKGAEIRMIRRALDRSGRPMVLSLSPGPTALAHAAEVAELAQMWRISDDFWDVWTSNGKEFPYGVKEQFARLAAWQPHARPGNWPDADMLPVGELKPVPGWGPPRTSRLTLDEQRTMLTLWAIARSPLIVGANLTMMDDPTLKLLTNHDMIRVSQTAVASREAMHQPVQGGDLIAWTADLPGSERALALFNTGDGPAEVSRGFAEFGLSEGGWQARDAWARLDMGRLQRVKATIAPHGCVLLMLDKDGSSAEGVSGGDAPGEVAQSKAATPPTIPIAQAMEHVITRVPATYPPIARAAHVKGDVVVGVEIDVNGHVTQTVVISGPEMLRYASLEAAKQWVYRPVAIDGEPAVVRSAEVFRFSDVHKNTSE